MFRRYIIFRSKSKRWLVNNKTRTMKKYNACICCIWCGCISICRKAWSHQPRFGRYITRTTQIKGCELKSSNIVNTLKDIPYDAELYDKHTCICFAITPTTFYLKVQIPSKKPHNLSKFFIIVTCFR